MFITVEDAIKLPSFGTARVVAGEKGLRRRILRVSVAECPEFPLDVDITGKDNLLFIDGEFLITSFYAIKDEPELLLQTIKLYNKYNSSGICIIERYYKHIPKMVLDYANKHDYPIISVSRTTAYADIISDITKAIYTQYNQQAACDVFDQILSANQSREKIKKLAYTLNANFKNNIVVFCIVCQNADNGILSKLNVTPGLSCFNYYHKIIIIASSNKVLKESEVDNIKSAIMEVLDLYKISYHIGISGIYNELYCLKEAIENAMIAYEICEVMDKRALSYDDMGIYKLLMKIPNRTILEEYYESIAEPVLKYDRLNKGNLFDTMMCFVKNSGDYKKTADELYQHENTIRYRMGKIKVILNREDNDLQFSEDICLVYKLHEYLNNFEK
ncbi:purine catabolism regulatory protein [Oxobacter pfennigii]|uniref:Purine catabolism regulatory protein n=1 Tax=Oxobacter pfennigii TaxID=36849 RepID=A0A0P8YSA7_9CLOT|nr:PucR family transcriptional regulator [Oxobacter pfennigii]KPU42542.1 purine catabolism regulatory protein [Oxobacter pfennigii]